MSFGQFNCDRENKEYLFTQMKTEMYCINVTKKKLLLTLRTEAFVATTLTGKTRIFVLTKENRDISVTLTEVALTGKKIYKMKSEI